MNYDVVIGLELHIETKTKSKMFSSAPTNVSAPPNTCVSVIDMAYPGTMPAVNKKAVGKWNNARSSAQHGNRPSLTFWPEELFL